MIIYHGSTIEIQNPDVIHSKRNLDFGPGFYLTTIRDQAERWALRKALRLRAAAVVSVYNIDETRTGFREKVFAKNDREWVEFVCACRRGGDVFKQYDVVIGGVANDKVYTVVDMYYRGIWDIDRTLSELRFYEYNDQICFLNQQLIDKHLSFDESYEVLEYDRTNR